MADATDLSVILELSRTHAPQDPYAFRFEPQTYTLRTRGGGRLMLEIDWSPALLADLEATRRPDQEPAVVQRVGDTLARFLERASWPAQAEAIVAAHDEGRRVLVTIRSNAAELYALPWELLSLPGRGQHLGSLPRVLLRYERPETNTRPELPAPRPEGGRILLAWSAAAGAVPAAAHEAALRKACAAAHPEREDALVVLPHATAESLADALARANQADQPFAVLHLLCHGGRMGQSFGLVLDGTERPVTVGADTWRTLLSPHAGSLRLVVLSACDGGNAGEPGNHLGSVAQALHAAGLQAVVASRHPLSTAGSSALAQTLYEGLLTRYESLEQALLRARARLALDPSHLDWASVQLHAREADGTDTRPFVFRPYRGLLAFEAEQTPFFFGREAERAEAVSDLEALVRAGRPRLLVVAGASGTGKSSLVRSGAVPDILATRGGAWEHAIIRPGRDPLGTLDTILAARSDPARSFLLVVDQFEEIFTHTEDREIRLAFARRLWALCSEDTGFHCILSLRVDFLGRCGELRIDDAGTRLDTVAYDEAHRVFVAQMAPSQLEDAITRPAELVGLVVQDGLAERIVAEVGMEPGALPLMQYTLDLMWQARRGAELTAEAYDALGGIVGSLERRADELLEELSDDELSHARRMLTQLVGLGDDDTGDTRRRVPVEQLWPPSAADRRGAETVLRRFVDERLLVRDDRTRGGATVEIAHEALIRRWARLREWLRDERQRRIGRYVVLETVREGRSEDLYLGFDPSLDRRVTITLLRVGRGGAEERARLRDQARALARLSHPNVIGVHDVGVARGHVYMAMEVVEGTSLAAWLAAQPRRWQEIIEVFVQVAEGLAAMHRAELVHRAFGLHAVLIGKDGIARVTDFALDRKRVAPQSRSASTIAARLQAQAVQSAGRGLPSAAAPDPSQMGSMSRSSVMLGSMAYTPPELLRGRPVSDRSDQFGFCVALYEAIHGELPFRGDSLAAFAAAVAESRPTGSRVGRSVGKGVGKGVGTNALRMVLLRGLEPEPDDRWPSMEALRSELQRLCAPPRRRVKTAGLVAAASAVMVGTLWWLVPTDDGAVAHTTMDTVLARHAQLDEAIAHLQQAIASHEDAVPPDPRIAGPLQTLASIELARGDHEAARLRAERAVATLEAARADPGVLAAARFTLARALWSDPTRRDRARALARQARDAHAELGEPGQRDVATLDAWLAEHP